MSMEGLVWKLAATGHVIVSLATRARIVRQVWGGCNMEFSGVLFNMSTWQLK